VYLHCKFFSQYCVAHGIIDSPKITKKRVRLTALPHVSNAGSLAAGLGPPLLEPDFGDPDSQLSASLQGVHLAAQKGTLFSQQPTSSGMHAAGSSGQGGAQSRLPIAGSHIETKEDTLCEAGVFSTQKEAGSQRQPLPPHGKTAASQKRPNSDQRSPLVENGKYIILQQY